MSSTISVPYLELEGLQEGNNSQGPWAKKPYLVAWNDRYQFVADMRGKSSTPAPGGPWIQVIPYRYPPSPNMYAVDLLVEPEGDIVEGSSPIEFTHARVTVTFGVPDWPYQPADDPSFLQSLTDDPAENALLKYAKQQISYGYETYPVPSSSLTYQSDGAKFNGHTVIKVAVVTLVITFQRYPSQPFKKIKDKLGTVNDRTWFGNPTGTVFFDDCQTEPQFDPDGTRTQQVMFRFKYRTIPWNKFLRPDGLTWDFLVDGSGNKFYASSNFRDIIAYV